MQQLLAVWLSLPLLLCFACDGSALTASHRVTGEAHRAAATPTARLCINAAASSKDAGACILTMGLQASAHKIYVAIMHSGGSVCRKERLG